MIESLEQFDFCAVRKRGGKSRASARFPTKFEATQNQIAIQALLADWKETRSITLAFLNELSDADLDKILPRKKLNTIRLHMYELTLGQQGYVTALTTKAVVFGDEYNNYLSLPTETLIATMTKLDAELERALELLNGSESVEFFGEQINVHQMLSMMNGHEQMHIGQIIAFCYATGIEIPHSISEQMNLEG
ncbi:MAG: DinB family protein [Defluviitaleaceae bacterium]|nr:DinB family protein [Defluviitaleaceae bacterium]